MIKFKSNSGHIYNVLDEPVEKLFTTKEIHDRYIQYGSDKCIQAFGHTSNEILEALHYWYANKWKDTNKSQSFTPFTETKGYKEALKSGQERINRMMDLETTLTRQLAIDRITARINGTYQILGNRVEAELFVDRCVALGILKLKEEPIIEKIFEISSDANIHWCKYPETSSKILKQYGTIIIEEWPNEGLVIWIDGEIIHSRKPKP